MKRPPIRSEVAALFQKKEEAKEQMAVPVNQPDGASMAFKALPDLPNWQAMLRHFYHPLNGKVVALRWNRTRKGVSECIDVVFPDKTAIRITRFIPMHGRTLALSLKRIEFK